MTDQRGGASSSTPQSGSAVASASASSALASATATASASASASGSASAASSLPESASVGLGFDPHGTGVSAAPHTQTSSDKPELPWAFIDCPSDILVILIAHMLDLLCQHNDQVVLTPDALTRFHSRAPPNITVIDYLRRIVKYTNLEKIPLLSLLAYIDLTCQNLPTFTLSSLTVHRFLIAGVTAGSKAQCDVFCTNSHYAKVGGIKVGELNSLEREFLRVTGWALCCNADLLQRYYTSLISSHGGYRQAVEPAVSPFQAFPDAGKAAPTDSNPTTPAGVDEDGDEAMARGSDYGSGDEAEEDDDDEDDEEDADVNGGIASQTTPTPGSASALPAGDRGRSRARGDTMDVDSPEVRAARTAASPATAAAPVPALPVPAPNRRSMSAERPTVGTARGALKQFVGGIFRRNETVPTTGPSPEKRLRSQPLGRSSSATTSPAVAPSTDTPKPLTPRVRTRDERSVDSLRGASPAAPVALDDGKRRARVE